MINIKKLTNASKSLDGLSYYILGRCYFSGELEQNVDYQKSFEYINKSADLGHPGDCFDMGKFYLKGSMGLKRNIEKSKFYLYKARDL